MSWKILDSKSLFSSGLFQLKADRCELPDGRIMPKYYVMNFPDWVNILPVTTEGELILVKQYRHASGRDHLEVPGGSIDPRLNETVQEGALREMLEETGFKSSKVEKIGSHFPNPALQSNQMHTFVAWDSIDTQAQNLDEFEDLELYFCSFEKLKKHLVEGDIDHSIMIASLSMALPAIEKGLGDRGFLEGK